MSGREGGKHRRGSPRAHGRQRTPRGHPSLGAIGVFGDGDGGSGPQCSLPDSACPVTGCSTPYRGPFRFETGLAETALREHTGSIPGIAGRRKCAIAQIRSLSAVIPEGPNQTFGYKVDE